MSDESPLLLALDLIGTFAFGLNDALTAVRVARLDIVGVITLGMITALGGGIIRDNLLDAVTVHTADELDRVAATLNRRARPTLGLETPANRLAQLLQQAA